MMASELPAFLVCVLQLLFAAQRQCIRHDDDHGVPISLMPKGVEHIRDRNHSDSRLGSMDWSEPDESPLASRAMAGDTVADRPDCRVAATTFPQSADLFYAKHSSPSTIVSPATSINFL